MCWVAPCHPSGSGQGSGMTLSLVALGHTIHALLLPKVVHALGCFRLPWQQVLGLGVYQVLVGSRSGQNHSSGVWGSGGSQVSFSLHSLWVLGARS